jgi:hypothetical protein
VHGPFGTARVRVRDHAADVARARIVPVEIALPIRQDACQPAVAVVYGRAAAAEIGVGRDGEARTITAEHRAVGINLQREAEGKPYGRHCLSRIDSCVSRERARIETVDYTLELDQRVVDQAAVTQMADLAQNQLAAPHPRRVGAACVVSAMHIVQRVLEAFTGIACLEAVPRRQDHVARHEHARAIGEARLASESLLRAKLEARPHAPVCHRVDPSIVGRATCRAHRERRHQGHGPRHGADAPAHVCESLGRHEVVGAVDDRYCDL